ncbi:MAG: bifunctional oligoribonuclease/PAP phosphatase NrnA [Candidatus Viridilinea halotolerans]|uniref:Bifunctional oligoribonuclease/PAP phosphatase NrnA n=1 Tax=Candidatus Viridilinea halotolerans TaxID=2491704 RepID=A0A426TZ57_9CHLR|nr:MAG: bifunctional oligoribonuclease/PAP phosphatase NrnA [Candidatus Viridilinea halotolerans]
MLYTEPHAAAPAFHAQLAQVERVLLLTHINPDGDAVGSLLGAAHVLQAIGKTPICMLSSPAPSFCASLPGAEWLQVYQQGTTLPSFDLAWMLDTAAPYRVGPPAEEHAAEMTARPLMIVDHHVTNDGLGQLNLINPQAASNADLLFRLFQAMQVTVSPAAATCLYLGMLTDTQSFQTSGTSMQTLHTAADLIAAGADRAALVNAVYFSVPLSAEKLTACVLSELQQEGGLIWTRVTRAQLAACGADNEATDNAIGRMQRVAGMRACVLFKERADGTVKLSLRSVPGINVAAFAQTWGGGGHTQAAGATLDMDLATAEATVLPLLRELVS